MTRVDSATRRLLFLDFDGVLHPTSVSDQYLFCRIPVLLQALDGLSCGIVIASSWRHHLEAKFILEQFPNPLREKIVGFTGDAHVGKWPRYQEIQNFRMAHHNPDWRALDDSFLEFPKHCPQLLLCDPNVGIDRHHVPAIRQWLRT